MPQPDHQRIAMGILHGRSDIFTQKDGPNRKLSGSGLIAAEQGRVKTL